MNRFKITFNNNNSLQPIYKQNLGSLQQKQVFSAKSSLLNAPMIGRIYNVKPGCSSCGKKVV